MNIFYKICVILIIIGGINWGLIGLFSFDAGRPVRRVHKTRFRAAPLHGSGPPLPFFVVPISPKAPPGRDFQSISCAAHFTETPLLVYNML